MPSGMRVEVEGITSLARTFRKVGDEGSRAFLLAANKEAASAVEHTARGLVPTRSGRLADTLRSAGNAKGGVVLAGKARVKYAGPIHFGWFKRGIRPQPFMFQALDRRAGDIEEIYHRRLDELLGMVQGADGA